MSAEFFRCPCGKLHAQSGIWWSGTVCPGCGRKLTPWGGAIEPKRIQMTRQRPWRDAHPDAVIVARPTKWGNPITFSEVGGQFPSLNDRQIATLVVRDFRALAERGTLHLPNWRFLGGQRGPVNWVYPSLTEIRAELGGKDLACWCPLDQPCHADVLLELANPREDPR